MPDVSICLASDVAAPPLFDRYIAIEGDPFRSKIAALRLSPYDLTLLLDVDTHVARAPTEIFELLSRFDFAVAHAPNRETLAFADIPSAYPEFNTGVIGCRRGKVTERLLDSWLQEYDRVLHRNPPSKDQPSLRRVLYYASEVRVATLPSEFNQRFEMAGFCNLPVAILHGWASPEILGQISGAMTAAASNWDSRAVFIDGKLLGRHAEVLLDWNLG